VRVLVPVGIDTGSTGTDSFAQVLRLYSHALSTPLHQLSNLTTVVSSPVALRLSLRREPLGLNSALIVHSLDMVYKHDGGDSW